MKIHCYIDPMILSKAHPADLSGAVLSLAVTLQTLQQLDELSGVLPVDEPFLLEIEQFLDKKRASINNLGRRLGITIDWDSEPLLDESEL